MRHLSIRHTIPLIVITPLIAVTTAIGFLTFHNGQQQVHKLIRRLTGKSTAAIEESVRNYLNTPYLLLESQVASVHSGNVNLENFKELERFFWQQIDQQKLVNKVYFGNEQGKFLSIEREKNEISVKVKDETTFPVRKVYLLDNQGNRTKLITSSNYEHRSRIWYQFIKKIGKPIWSPIYVSAAFSKLVIAFGIPVYDKKSGSFNGIIATDIPLERISFFLKELPISPTGKAFIIERSGAIVATSSTEKSLITINNEQKQINLAQSGDTLIQATGKYLLQEFGSFERINGNQQLTFMLNGKPQLVEVSSLQEGQGIDWLMVVVIPESDFMEDIYASVQFTIIFGLVVILVAIYVAILAVKLIVQPIKVLDAAAKDIESDKFEPSTLDKIVSRQDELGKLGKVFLAMANVIYDREQTLKQSLQQALNNKQQVDFTSSNNRNNKVNQLEVLLRTAKQIREQTSDKQDEI